MNRIRKRLPVRVSACVLAIGMLAGMIGCGEKDTEESTSASESSEVTVATGTEEGYVPSDPNDMDYALTYDSDNIPDDLAQTVALYFYAVDTQNYDLYLEQIDSLYQTYMEDFLQEEYGYGMENGLEQFHQSLVNYAGTDDFTIESMEIALASEALAEDFEEDTDFVGEYLDTYTEAFGEEFTTKLKEQSDAIYDIAVTMKGKDGDGNEITILDGLEILVSESDGSFGILG